MRWLIWKSLSIQLSDVKPAKPGGKWTQSKVWLSIPGILWGFFKDSLDILWRFVHSLKIWFSWRSLRDLDSIWIRFWFDLDSIRFFKILNYQIFGDSWGFFQIPDANRRSLQLSLRFSRILRNSPEEDPSPAPPPPISLDPSYSQESQASLKNLPEPCNVSDSPFLVSARSCHYPSPQTDKIWWH